MSIYAFAADKPFIATGLQPIVYRGGYLDCFAKIDPRHGHGSCYNPHTHHACWKGHFKADSPKEGININEDGWYTPVLQQEPIPIPSPTKLFSFDVFPITLTSIDIAKGSGNEQTCTSVDLSSFTQLRTLRIGASSFLFTTSFCCSDMDYLESIQIGEGCFSLLADGWPVLDPSRSCCIARNPSLRELLIAPFSFANYDAFTLTGRQRKEFAKAARISHRGSTTYPHFDWRLQSQVL